MNPIKLVAHRGHQTQYPENTLLSLAEAIHAGARYVETDIQLSRDQVPVLYHDNHMRRISGVKGAIHDYSFAELITIPAYEPKRFGDKFLDLKITPLADLVRLLVAHPQVHAYIEIKRCAIQQQGIEVLYRRVTDLLMPVVEQCTLISFSIPFIEYACQTAWPSLGVVVERWRDIECTPIQAIKPDYIFCDYKQLPRTGTISLPHTRLVIYEIDKAATAIKLIERGANMIETFAFAELQQALDKRLHA